MGCARVYLDFMREPPLLEQSRDLVRLFDGHNVVPLPVQNQHRGDCFQSFELFRHPAVEIDNGLDALLSRCEREREVGSERKAHQSDSLPVGAGMLRSKIQGA